MDLSTPREMLLDRIRLIEKRTGTKEGCNEGDCGACTVVLRRVVDGKAVHTAVNSCILFTGQTDGAEIITIEDLSRNGTLHPVQAAMVKHHGSQCGFCTPGIVMSLYALYENTTGPVTREEVLEALQGNLCRCTGYRPIVDAALEACASRSLNPSPERERGRGEGLKPGFASNASVAGRFSNTPGMYPHPRPLSHSGEGGYGFLTPETEDDFAALLLAHPDALIVSGATDVGLWVTKRLDDPKKIAWTGKIAGFDRIERRGETLFIGAGATHAAARPHLAAIAPDLDDIMRRFGSAQVRNSGTIGGNIANGSPIGDLAPCLIALGATLHLRRGDERRDLPLEHFFIAYGKQDRRPGEFVTGVSIPMLAKNQRFAAYKLSKRPDEDISSVLLAALFTMGGERIAAARIACGGMAGTPKRAPLTEAALAGLSISDESALSAAIETLAKDYQPLTDMRASAAYRMEGAKALLKRAVIPGRSEAKTREPHRATPQSFPALRSAPAGNDGPAGNDAAVVHLPLPHDSAIKHVSGVATYTDDALEPAGTLQIGLGLASIARGRIESIDLEPVRAAPGVVRVITAADVRGKNDCSPVDFDIDPIFAEERILFHSQLVFAVAATSRDAARRAAKLAKITYAKEKPNIAAEDGVAANEFVQPDYRFARGDAAATLNTAPTRLKHSFRIGGQEHFYLEGQIALATPGEDGDMHVLTSTQHPSEVQHVVARALGVSDNAVIAEVRRMGGGFGGKESQASQWAAIAAVCAQVTGRPCKLRLDRDDDFATTGKRHDFRVDLDIGFDAAGKVTAYDATYVARCGYSADLSGGICDRTMFHADNAYWLPEVSITTRRARTNTVSNTAFRGFGGPQGMVGIERAMDIIAWKTGQDPLDVRKANFYRDGADVTPYGMRIEDNIALEITEALEATSDYRARRKALAEWNAGSPVLKKGIALTPVKFGISFTLTHLNQAGALVHVYSDGSVHLNHGGTEMGQGLYVKVAQVCAEEFGLPLEAVKITATTTAKVPNTAPTAASAGSDLNGMAAREAARTIKARMAEHFATLHQCSVESVSFAGSVVRSGQHEMSFKALAKSCVLNRISLSSTGFYKTPKVIWDRPNAKGRPFFYFAYGAACSEVTVDTSTGEYTVDRVDILHDVGKSLNPAIDIGQIEGGFVQGMGWLTTEELWWDGEGRLRTHAPSTYKIPVASDVPADFRVALWQQPNREDTIYRSKAVGEPPVMLAISVFNALADAVHAKTGGIVQLDAPATPEAVLWAVTAGMTGHAI